jgi:hypothetical protein
LRWRRNRGRRWSRGQLLVCLRCYFRGRVSLMKPGGSDYRPRDEDVLKEVLVSSVCWLGGFRRGLRVRLERRGRDDVFGSGASLVGREGAVLSIECTMTDFCQIRRFATMVLGGLSWIGVDMRKTKSANMVRMLTGFRIGIRGRRNQERAYTWSAIVLTKQVIISWKTNR